MMKIAKFGIVLLFTLLSLAAAALAQPALNAIADQTVNEGQLLSFTITSSAADNPAATTPVTYKFCDSTAFTGTTPCTLTSPNSVGFAEITVGSTKVNLSNTSATSAQFNWTPSPTQEGIYKFKVSAEDADSENSKIFTVTVKDVAPSLTVPAKVILGGTSQRRSNPNHDNAEDREVNVTATFTITNNGIEQLTALTGAFVLGGDSSKASKGGLSLADLNNKISMDKTSLNPGESATVTLEMRVPEKLSAVDTKGVPTAWNVASINVVGTRTQSGHTSEKVTTPVTLTLQAENRLVINDGKITFDTKSEGINDGENVKDVRPGDEMTLEVELENKFRDKEDVTIESIEVLAESDDDIDVDESEDGNDLDAEDTDTVELNFNVDDNTPKSDQELVITALGEDENGAVHGETWTITLEVDREDHEIDIRGLELTPETAACEADVVLSVDVRNTGRRDEDSVYVRVSAPDLKFSKISEELSLDEDDDDTEVFAIPLSEDLKAGTYRITVDTYYDTSKKSQSDGIILKKSDCNPDAAVPDDDTPTQDGTQQPPVVVVTPPTQQQPDNNTPAPTVQSPVVQDSKSFFDSTAFLVLIILGYVVVLGTGVAIVIKLLRK